jgi:hypothetical protein
MLSKIDKLKVVNRINGIKPLLLCDGNDILVEEPAFLEYTYYHRRGHCHVALVLHMTHLCGKFGTLKMESRELKEDTVRVNIRAILPVKLRKSDIVLIVNMAGQNLFHV